MSTERAERALANLTMEKEALVARLKRIEGELEERERDDLIRGKGKR